MSSAADINHEKDQYLELGVSVVRYIRKYKSDALDGLKRRFKKFVSKLLLNEERGELEIKTTSTIDEDDIRQTLDVAHLKTDFYQLTDAGAVKYVTERDGRTALDRLETKYNCAIYVQIGPPKLPRPIRSELPAPPVHRYMIGSLRVFLQGGDISQLKVDVFVNELPQHGYVAQSTLQAAFLKISNIPAKLIKQVERKIRNNPEQIIETESFGLVSAPTIFHFCLKDYKSQTGEILRVMYEVLNLAETKEVKSVVFPVIGCTDKRYPPTASAEEMYTALKMFVPGESSSLESVTIWISDRDVLLEFRQVFNRFWLEGVPVDTLERYIPSDTTDSYEERSLFEKYAPRLVKDLVATISGRKKEEEERINRCEERREAEKSENRDESVKMKKTEEKKTEPPINCKPVEEVKPPDSEPMEEDDKVVEKPDEFKFYKERYTGGSNATIFVTAGTVDNLQAVLAEVQKLKASQDVERRIKYPVEGLSNDLERKIWMLCTQHKVFNMIDRKMGEVILKGNKQSVSTLAEQIKELM